MRYLEVRGMMSLVYSYMVYIHVCVCIMNSDYINERMTEQKM